MNPDPPWYGSEFDPSPRYDPQPPLPVIDPDDSPPPIPEEAPPRYMRDDE